jgi:hypothetical protein
MQRNAQQGIEMAHRGMAQEQHTAHQSRYFRRNRHSDGRGAAAGSPARRRIYTADCRKCQLRAAHGRITTDRAQAGRGRQNGGFSGDEMQDTVYYTRHTAENL